MSFSLLLSRYLGQLDNGFKVLGGGCLIAYGVPASYWMRSGFNTNQKKYQTKFIRTYLLLPCIWWFLVVLIFGIALLYLSHMFSSEVTKTEVIKTLVLVLIVWGVYAAPNYLIYLKLKDYVDQSSEILPLDSIHSEEQQS